ncbi:hypothetical protein D9756_002550 [Leucocoprinus leucothites]|uniref:Uncharacterized protein n=1 Tax=Leucocoprinus leucothites TaxID=201217 RepID=A0A8H5GD62_9AGAR|nr:hypothetical protein D9756_002550 [Leucoagaricus leucothites]
MCYTTSALSFRPFISSSHSKSASFTMPLCGTSSNTNSFGRSRPIQRKVVVCGDGATGKTSLLNVFTRGFFTQVYEPTVFENYVHDLYVEDQLVELSLWDTAGPYLQSPCQEEFDRLRSLSYAETHVIMICFSVDNPTSLENVESKWLDEILEYCPGVKLVLVGTLATPPFPPRLPPSSPSTVNKLTC